MPAPTLESYPPMLRPFVVLDTRLTHHSVKGSGRLLDGLKYDFEGTLKGRGVADFPYLQPVGYSDNETIGPGANMPMGGKPAAVQGNALPWDEFTFAFWLWVRREYGLYRRALTGDAYGLLDWVGRIRDAVETDTDSEGTLDRRLRKMCATNIQSSVVDNEITDIGWGVVIEFTIQTDTYCPGMRTVTRL